MGQKRRPKTAAAAPGDQKRRKLDSAQDSGRDHAAKGRPTKIDALDWKTVSMPDKLDDYEGLLDFEEVDDVVVLREGGTGQVTYVSNSAEAPATNGAADEADHDDSDGDAEEWNGFEADDPAPAVAEVVNAKPAKEKAKKQPKSKEAKKSNPSTSAKTSASGAFAGLESAAQVEEADVSAWKALRLSPDTLAALSRLRFSSPTSIQQSAIPEILSGHDVIGKASTGSGKTLAFGIPILERFLELRSLQTQRKSGADKTPLALLLSPTRELAHQLNKHLTALCSNGLFEGPSIATVTGGLSMQKQQRQLKKADIIIGTPGRLWEVIGGGQGLLDQLKKIQFLVVDEADRLLSDGHFKEVEEILSAIARPEQEVNEKEEPIAATGVDSSRSTERQTLVFSATFDRGLQTKLATRNKPSRPDSNILGNRESMEYLLSKLPFQEEEPKFIDASPVSQLATGLKEGLIECGGTEKDLYLYGLLLLNSNARTLVFTNSISSVRRLTPFLQNLDLPALALHSSMPQKARLRSVERFTQTQNSRQGSILVATDVAARGLDIANVQLVVHYHLPRAADTYVHRSGRTARAGASGSSVLLCGPEEVMGVRRLVAKVHAHSALGDAGEAKKQGYYIRTLDLDRRIIARLKPRAHLSKQIADASLAKEKGHRADDFFRAAADELGVDYDSEELDRTDSGRRGRGSGRKQKEREARGMTKGEVGAMRAELKALLRERVNVGVSERYLTAGNVDIDELLRQKELGDGKTGEFLGRVDGLMGLEDM